MILVTQGAVYCNVCTVQLISAICHLQNATNDKDSFVKNQAAFKLQQNNQSGVDSELKQINVWKNFQTWQEFLMKMKMLRLFNDNEKSDFPSKSIFKI